MRLIPECKYASNFTMQIPRFWNASPGLATGYLLLSSPPLAEVLSLPGTITQRVAAFGSPAGGPLGRSSRRHDHWFDHPAGSRQLEAPRSFPCPWNVHSVHVPHSQKLPQGHSLEIVMW